MAPLDRLLEKLTAAATAATDGLASDGSVEAWRAEMERILARGHLAGYALGQEAFDFSDKERSSLVKQVAAQLEFLDNFVLDVQSAPEFQKGWNARAAMYAEAVGASYYRGKFKLWPLPSVPGDGTTQCLSRCNCSWDVQELEGDGNADAYWRLGPSESCQTCEERASQWAPLRIREGEVQ
jgi:hypothetical protein